MGILDELPFILTKFYEVFLSITRRIPRKYLQIDHDISFLILSYSPPIFIFVSYSISCNIFSSSNLKCIV